MTFQALFTSIISWWNMSSLSFQETRDNTIFEKRCNRWKSLVRSVQVSNSPACDLLSFENISKIIFCAHTHSQENNNIEFQMLKMSFSRRDGINFEPLYVILCFYLLILNDTMSVVTKGRNDSLNKLEW